MSELERLKSSDIATVEVIKKTGHRLFRLFTGGSQNKILRKQGDGLSKIYKDLYPLLSVSHPVGNADVNLSYSIKTQTLPYNALDGNVQYISRNLYRGRNPLLKRGDKAYTQTVRHCPVRELLPVIRGKDDSGPVICSDGYKILRHPCKLCL